jgi:8-oxo-dGTP diphosphatase
MNKNFPAYDENKYRNPAVTVDIIILTRMGKLKGLYVLLIKRKNNPFKNCRAIPGGFVDINKNESLEEAAYRELREETSLSIKDLNGFYLKQHATYGDPDRDPRTRVISVVFYAVVPYSMKLLKAVKARDDAKEAAWFPLSKLPVKMAFDHKTILADLKTKISEGF